MVDDSTLEQAVRTLFELDIGFGANILDLVEIWQHENGNFGVRSKGSNNELVWTADDLPLDVAIGHFLRIRRARQIGFDIESDLLAAENGARADASPDATS